MEGREVIQGERVTLRPATPRDADLIRTMADEPSVARWWDDGTGTEWVDDVLDDPDTFPYVVEVDGAPIGYVHWYEELEPGYRSAAIDLFLRGDAQGVGYGREVVGVLVRWLIDVRGHHRVEIDPTTSNERAIRCYRAVGFRDIGVARRRERSRDGAWRDSLLMEYVVGVDGSSA